MVEGGAFPSASKSLRAYERRNSWRCRWFYHYDAHLARHVEDSGWLIMIKLILFAGAAAFALATPALAQPAHSNAHQGKAQSAKSHGKAQGKAHSGPHGRHMVTMRDGTRLYALDARGACPPGLAKKNNGCMPPGQAKKLFNVGQRYDHRYGHAWRYDQIPYHLRSQYRFDPSGRYYYRDGYLYQVDPRTMLVRQVVSALLR
jgi:hypothetical protein